MTAPAGIADGDILIAIVNSANNGDSITLTGAGFTLKSSRTTTNRAGTQAIFWKRASGESGNYTTDGSPAGILFGFVIAVSGAIASGDPFDVAPGLNDKSNSGTAMTCSAITPTTDGCLIESAFCDFNTGSTHSAYSGGGLTWAQDASSGTTNTTDSCASAVQATAGAVTPSATDSSTSFVFMYAWALKPAVSGGGVPGLGVIARVVRRLVA